VDLTICVSVYAAISHEGANSKGTAKADAKRESIMFFISDLFMCCAKDLILTHLLQVSGEEWSLENGWQGPQQAQEALPAPSFFFFM
jgi:hypothetical protein